MLDPPNPKCYVCAEQPEVTVQLNPEKVTVKTLEEKVSSIGSCLQFCLNARVI